MASSPAASAAPATAHLQARADAPVPPTASSPAGHAPTGRLAHFPVTFFAVVMGLAGLSLAWLRAHATLGAPAPVGQALFWLSAVTYLAVLTTYVLKWARHPDAVRAEVAHPVRLAFVPTSAIALLLVAAAGREIVPAAAQVMWWAGVAGQLVATLAVLTTWINRPVFAMQHVSPAWFIPVVGTLVVPLAGTTFGPLEVSWFFWSAGLVSWGALLPLVLTRLFVHEAPVPGKLLPTLAILIAPPAVAFVGLALLDPGPVGPADRVLYYAAVFFALLFVAQVGRLRRLPFFLSWWAYSFPLAGLTVATTMMAAALGSGALRAVSWGLLGLSSALVAVLGVRTVRAMLTRQVCVPE